MAKKVWTAQEMGKKGSKRRAELLSVERKREIARIAAAARWAKKKAA